MTQATLVGTLRNGSKYLDKEIPNLIELLNQIFDLRILIVESDSDDDTVETLVSLSKKYQNLEIKTFGALRETIPDRVDRIRFCRNYYVNEIRENLKYAGSDFIIVADLDGVNNRLKIDSIKRAVYSQNQWDGLTANQDGPYYDLYALRHPQMMRGNFLEELEGLSRRESVKLKKKILWSKMIRIPEDADLIPVESAFGGFAIYKRWIFETCNYGNLGETQECEHVSLNRCAVIQGGRIFIAPYLINTSWNEHNLSKYLFFRIYSRVRNLLTRIYRSHLESNTSRFLQK